METPFFYQRKVPTRPLPKEGDDVLGNIILPGKAANDVASIARIEDGFEALREFENGRDASIFITVNPIMRIIFFLKTRTRIGLKSLVVI